MPFKFLNVISAVRYTSRYEIRKIASTKLNSFRYYSAPAQYDIKLEIQGKPLKNYITSLEKEFQTLSNTTASNTRLIELQPLIKLLENRKSVVDNISNLKEFFDGTDEELKKLAEEEKIQFENKLKEIDENLLLALVPSDDELIFNSLILEVQAGVGGQEAMLFAKEIFEMYCNFSNHKGWDLQTLEYFISEIGGIRSASAVISGNGVYQYFRHEAGIHRVQRIPATEKSGRVHTSTISVAVLPQPSEIQVKINSNDLKVETKRSSGAGGQHVNKTESAVRITHLPSGVVVECQEDRSQIKNRKLALAKLRAILFQKQIDDQYAETTEQRKKQVKSRNRNEKIRTYNFKDDRITDHRLGVNCYNLSGFFEGTELLNKLIEQLEEQHKINSLLEVVDNIS